MVGREVNAAPYGAVETCFDCTDYAIDGVEEHYDGDNEDSPTYKGTPHGGTENVPGTCRNAHGDPYRACNDNVASFSASDLDRALQQRDIQGLALMVSTPKIYYNAERQAIQIADCAGNMIAHFAVDAQVAEALASVSE